MNTAEKIETIVLCYLQDGTATGTCGNVCKIEDTYLVHADGKYFSVKTTPFGWEVYHGGFAAIDENLYAAAALALVP